jgi:hypothetical protein
MVRIVLQASLVKDDSIEILSNPYITVDSNYYNTITYKPSVAEHTDAHDLRHFINFVENVNNKSSNVIDDVSIWIYFEVTDTDDSNYEIHPDTMRRLVDLNIVVCMSAY